jgi:hypothetical protein
MKFIYSTEEAEPFPFRKIGGVLTEHNTVELTDGAYKRFLESTAGTTHRLELYKETAPWKT